MSAKTIILTMGTAARVNRLKAAAYFIAYPKEFKALLDLTFDTDFKLHYKAAWVLEFVVAKDLNLIVKHLEYFISSIHKIKKDSAARPISKITNLIVQKHIDSKKNHPAFILSSKQIDLIITTAFDWLIGNYRVATKVYAMQIIFDLGSLMPNQPWILRELKNILKENSAHQTAAYRNRALKIRQKLELDF